MLDVLLISIRNNFQIFTWLAYILLAVSFVFFSWRLQKGQVFFWIVLVILLESALFFTVSSVPTAPFHMAPTLMIIALLTLSVGIKSAYSYIVSLFINIIFAIGLAFLLDFMRKVILAKRADN